MERCCTHCRLPTPPAPLPDFPPGPPAGAPPLCTTSWTTPAPPTCPPPCAAARRTAPRCGWAGGEAAGTGGKLPRPAACLSVGLFTFSFGGCSRGPAPPRVRTHPRRCFRCLPQVKEASMGGVDASVLDKISKIMSYMAQHTGGMLPGEGDVVERSAALCDSLRHGPHSLTHSAPPMPLPCPALSWCRRRQEEAQAARARSAAAAARHPDAGGGQGAGGGGGERGGRGGGCKGCERWAGSGCGGASGGSSACGRQRGACWRRRWRR